MKKNTGFKRIILAGGYSIAGLRAAFQHEAAFRQELYFLALLIPLTFWLNISSIEQAIMVSSLLLILIVELLNSAIEAIVDRISTEHHPLSGRAKDLGSAAVFVALLLAAIVWLIILYPKFVSSF